MRTSNAKPSSRPGNPIWYLLAEFPLRDFSSDHDRTDGTAAGLLFQKLQELGMSPECTDTMAMTLAEYAKETFVRYKQGRLEFAGQIQIFCQKEMIDDANPANPSRSYHPEQAKKREQISPGPPANVVGGWGFFVIERGDDPPPDSPAVPHNCIDLYVYKEGALDG